MFTKIDRDRTWTNSSATMRASYMSVNRVVVQQAVLEVARFVAEPNEGVWIMLKRLVRYFVGAGDFGTEVRQGSTRRHR